MIDHESIGVGNSFMGPDLFELCRGFAKALCVMRAQNTSECRIVPSLIADDQAR